jgi:hypothetical protein
MEPPIYPLVFVILLFLGMQSLLEAGRRLGVRHSKEGQTERSGLGAIESAVFALFGLIIAFTFSGAASRFNEKRMLIAEEVNAIETAYLRVQLVSPAEQIPLEALIRRYLDSRLETYRRLPDMQAAEIELANSRKLQKEIWTTAIAAARLPDSDPAAGWLLAPALNNMIDIATTRTMALQLHPPRLIYALLFGLGLICSLLAGYRMGSGQQRSWLHILGFTLITVIVVYVMLDIEYPRTGLFRLEAADKLLIDARTAMNEQ